MALEVRFRPAARRDIVAIYNYIASEAGDRVALDYVGRVEAGCQSLTSYPERGTLREDLGGVRILVVERRTTIAFFVRSDEVVIVGIFHSGRDILGALRRRLS